MKKLFLSTIVLILLSCGGAKKVQQAPQKYDPRFDFTPQERANPRSADITIALINPVFSNTDSSRYAPPYSTFIENMADDFEEMLIAKGFTIRGPFASRDEMVYGDKKDSDIALEISVSLKDEGAIEIRQGSKTNWGAIINPDAKDFVYYKVGGTFYHSGSLIIEATDPFNGEKFWKKTVSLPRKEINTQGYTTFSQKPKYSEILNDVGVYNPVARALEEYYKEAIQTAWRHIDTEEMKLVKKEIRASKNK